MICRVPPATRESNTPFRTVLLCLRTVLRGINAADSELAYAKMGLTYTSSQASHSSLLGNRKHTHSCPDMKQEGSEARGNLY